MLKQLDRGIPKEDLDIINKSFSRKEGAQIIVKNHTGSRVTSGRREVNARSFILESFVGKILRMQKDLHENGKQIVAGRKGERWEDIPEEVRSRVAWFESDFE